MLEIAEHVPPILSPQSGRMYSISTPWNDPGSLLCNLTYNLRCAAVAAARAVLVGVGVRLMRARCSLAMILHQHGVTREAESWLATEVNYSDIFVRRRRRGPPQSGFSDTHHRCDNFVRSAPRSRGTRPDRRTRNASALGRPRRGRDFSANCHTRPTTDKCTKPGCARDGSSHIV